MIPLNLLSMVVMMIMAMMVGLRLGALALGLMGGFSVAMTALGLHLAPVDPPFEVLMVMISVITAASVLEAAGGLDYFTEIAAKLIRRYPNHITWLSPLVGYVLVWSSGTSHIIYPFLSIVMRTAEEVGVKKSKVLLSTVLSARQAVIASPLSAAMAVLLSVLTPFGYGLLAILKVLLPATLVGVIGITVVSHLLYLGGKEREDLPGYGDGKRRALRELSTWQAPYARGSFVLFGLGLIVLLALGGFSSWRTVSKVSGEEIVLKMSYVVSMVMLGVGVAMQVMCKVSSQAIVNSKVFQGGMQAVVGLLGMAWLGNTFLAHAMDPLISWIDQGAISGVGKWALLLFVVTILSSSPATTLQIIMPLALRLDLEPAILLAILPAVESLYLLPTYPTIQAAMILEGGKDLKVGQFIINHSFLLPGLAGTLFAVITAYLLSSLF